MNTDSWIQVGSTIVTAAVSVASIFAANRLGRRDYLNKLDVQHKSERYHQLYLPLLQLLINASPVGLNYSNFSLLMSAHTFEG
ncbi:hypothetical protein [Lactiplantibacillus plantarum]|uniref:hypothetical protein n=1 Tax=Lactiplantibacillus plantarum TaxID=1590 RepID=UPI000A7F0119|nr:hypothetical protein [Lactiplantibacillus plantarum]